jgi:hypothetical protein
LKEQLNVVFFNNKKVHAKPQKPVSEFDLKAAKLLYKAIIAKTQLTRKPSMRAWAEEIRLLRKAASKSSILEMIEWYSLHSKDKYTPWIFSGTTFRAKFPQLLEAKARAQAEPQRVRRTITGLANIMAESLKQSYHWPKGSEAQVAEACQIGIDELTELFERMNSKFHELTTQKLDFRDPRVNILNFILHLRDYVADARQFVPGWMADINGMISRWSNWHGDLLKLALSIESKKFQQMGYDWSNEWSGSNQRWDQLMQELGYKALYQTKEGTAT